MLKSQRLQIKAAELRAKVAETDSEIAQALKEEVAEIDQHRAEYGNQPFGQTAETRELRSLAGKASVDRILRASVRGWGISDGPEHELQSHFDLDSNVLPLVMLLDDEVRVAASFGTSPGTPGTSPGISGQVFGDSASAFANVRFEDVAPGVRIHPVITTGALTSAGVSEVSTPAKSAEVTETDAVLSVKELTPKRAQHGFSYTLEDAMTYPGLDEGLRRNLRLGLRDKVDQVILNRTDEGLLDFGSDPTAPTAATTAAQYIAAASAVDGRFATRESEVKMVVGETIYGHTGQALATGDGRTVTDKLGDRVRVSQHVAAYAGNKQDAVVCKGNMFQTVCAIWPGIPILVDQASRGAHGEVRLWAVLMHDFAILRTDGYTRHAFRNS